MSIQKFDLETIDEPFKAKKHVMKWLNPLSRGQENSLTCKQVINPFEVSKYFIKWLTP